MADGYEVREANPIGRFNVRVADLEQTVVELRRAVASLTTRLDEQAAALDALRSQEPARQVPATPRRR